MRFLMSAFVVLSLFVVGCKSQPVPPIVTPICDVLASATTGAAQGVGAVFDCANISAIVATLNAPIQKLNICPKDGEKVQGLVGDIVCPAVTKFVMDLGVNALPAAWECKGGTTVENVATLLADKCKVYVKF